VDDLAHERPQVWLVRRAHLQLRIQPGAWAIGRGSRRTYDRDSDTSNADTAGGKWESLKEGGRQLRRPWSLRQRVSFGSSQGRFPLLSRSQKRAPESFSSSAFALARSALICSCIDGSSFGTGSAIGGPSAGGVIANNVNRSAIFIVASYWRAQTRR